MSGGAATAITKDAAKKLLASTIKFGRPVDVDIQCSWETGVNVLSLMPYPFAQDLSYDSTIKEPSKRIKSSFLLRKQQQLVNGLMNREQVKKHVREFKHALLTSAT